MAFCLAMHLDYWAPAKMVKSPFSSSVYVDVIKL